MNLILTSQIYEVKCSVLSESVEIILSLLMPTLVGFHAHRLSVGHHIKSIILRYDILLAPCTYPVVMVHDRWGATGIATLSLHLILLSASLRALQNFNPVHSEILFSQRFFCRPLLLPPCTLDTCPNHLNLRFPLLWLRYHHGAQWLA